MLYCPKREEINPRDLGLGKSQGEVRGSNVFFYKSNIKYLAKSGGNIWNIWSIWYEPWLKYGSQAEVETEEEIVIVEMDLGEEEAQWEWAWDLRVGPQWDLKVGPQWKVGWRVGSRVWAQWEKMIWKLLLLNKFAVEKKRQGLAILKGMILLMHLHEEAYYWYKLGGKYIQPSISDPPTRERYLRQNVGGDNGNRISRSDQTLIEPNLLNEQMEHWRL